MSTDPIATAFGYHQRTRHAPHAFARSLAYLDWESQPDPFRRYAGADVVLLDRSPGGPDPRYDAVCDGALPSPAPLDWESLSRLLYDALALSAWKEAGDARWSLRVNPSSGNLHPTEAYVVCGPVPGVGDAPGVYHYNAFLHGLERRATLPDATWRRLAADLPEGAVIVGLTSIVWREAWKYGERAFRYCQHDVGHAIAALAYAAGGLGFTARLLESVPDAAIGELLGVNGQTGPEAEVPECLLAIYPSDLAFPLPQWRHFRVPTLPPLAWAGTPNRLSPEHHEWPILAVAEEATRKVSPAPGAPSTWAPPPSRRERLADRAALLRSLTRQRRSAVEMDGRSTLPREAFLRTLARLLPGAPPFDPLPWAPAVHLALFVHRVEGVPPGLYALVRDPTVLPALKAALAPRFRWEPAAEGLPFYLLDPTDVRGLASHVSCGQAIAGDGAFAVAMLADLPGGLAEHGAWFYRRIHWEAGAIGQALYLEAESDGVRGTGIGCFYDDATRQALGIAAASGWTTMYHFTVGGPIDDDRLRTLDPYGHLEG
ncbi:MAG: SagB/ThcOx family dehydrogenase [Pseudomonadota bacterium]|nr:SagB/ThcOx family dehydrogenase [Pseudomonadota bacterium]